MAKKRHTVEQIIGILGEAEIAIGKGATVPQAASQIGDTVQNATVAPQREAGHMAASDSAGLGIEPNMDALGKAVAEYKE